MAHKVVLRKTAPHGTVSPALEAIPPRALGCKNRRWPQTAFSFCSHSPRSNLAFFTYSRPGRHRLGLCHDGTKLTTENQIFSKGRNYSSYSSLFHPHPAQSRPAHAKTSHDSGHNLFAVASWQLEACLTRASSTHPARDQDRSHWAECAIPRSRSAPQIATSLAHVPQMNLRIAPSRLIGPH